jgi:hypothetical protein
MNREGSANAFVANEAELHALGQHIKSMERQPSQRKPRLRRTVIVLNVVVVGAVGSYAWRRLHRLGRAQE